MSRAAKLRLLKSVAVFWPWIIIVIEFIVIALANQLGCEISVRGPSPCVVFGAEIGPALYPLWSVGYQIALSLLWVFPALLFWAILEIFASRSQSNGANDGS
ncbi:MAG: hypothetical protein MK098_01210 [Marinovum sp.]|nr:hypothetical protein [Marinovum sp.]